MNKSRTVPRRDPPLLAFTLLELLVVMSIVAVLAGLLLPLFGSITQKARATTTLSNMRQFGVACLLYVGDNDNQLPKRADAPVGQAQPDKWPKLFQQYIPDLRAYTSPIPDANGKSYRVSDQTLLLSNDTNYTSYIMNGYNDLGAFTDATVTPRLSSVRLPTQTILFGIPYPRANNFYMDFVEGAGNNNDVLNRTAFQGSAVYVFCDGSSRMLKYDPKENMKSPPTHGADYTDWLWLLDKNDTFVIQ